VNDADRVPRFLVVDASVSLKWVLDDEVEVASSVALRDDGARGRIQTIAPSLWVYEVTNALVVARRRGRMDSEQSRRALELLQDLGPRMADPEPENCLELAAKLEISGCDAAYVALADALGAELWTGDRKLFEKVRDQADLVRWIGDYPTGGPAQGPAPRR